MACKSHRNTDAGGLVHGSDIFKRLSIEMEGDPREGLGRSRTTSCSCAVLHLGFEHSLSNNPDLVSSTSRHGPRCSFKKPMMMTAVSAVALGGTEG
jgi:hypothetical protein